MLLHVVCRASFGLAGETGLALALAAGLSGCHASRHSEADATPSLKAEASMEAGARPTASAEKNAADTGADAPADAPDDASESGDAPSPDEWGLLTLHEGYGDLVRVADQTVLLGCHKLRILDADLMSGREVAAPDVDFCPPHQPYVCGVHDRAIVLRPLFSSEIGYEVDVDTGKRHPEPDAGPFARGCDRDELGRSSGNVVLRDGTDVVSFGESGGVRLLDPKTHATLWEYSLPSRLLGPMLVHRGDGEEVVALRGGLAGDRVRLADGGWSFLMLYPQEIRFFAKGAPPIPLWTGKVRGKLELVGDKLREFWVVQAGDTQAPCNPKNGSYELSLSTRGSVVLEARYMGASGATSSPTVIQPDPSRRSYTANVSAHWFEQSCGGMQ
jgi:hypothetical protein